MWQRLAERKGVSNRIQWLGQVPHADVLRHFHWADVFVFTSLRDATGTVVLEALAAAKPVICLDHQGAGAIVTNECGIKIPVTNRKSVQLALSEAIMRLHSDRRLCKQLAAGAYKRAAEYVWSSQAARIADAYNHILAACSSDAHCSFTGPAAWPECRSLPRPTKDRAIVGR
jgi:glycosyltransferase involved in cell wall biosynthesis